ncbi:MAG TPA: T9SS type A sorting domain-containing protein, partial [Chitinophagaceae bacterium]
CALGIEKISEERHILVDTVFCKFPTIQCGEQKIEIVYEDEYILTDIITELASSVSTSIPEIISHVKIYPNPFTSNIIVTLEKNDINSNFELFDIAGRKIMTSKLNNSINKIQFNKPGGGIYMYRLTNSKGKVFATGKLVRK